MTTLSSHCATLVIILFIINFDKKRRLNYTREYVRIRVRD
jgi:hypothetical protein